MAELYKGILLSQKLHSEPNFRIEQMDLQKILKDLKFSTNEPWVKISLHQYQPLPKLRKTNRTQ